MGLATVPICAATFPAGGRRAARAALACGAALAWVALWAGALVLLAGAEGAPAETLWHLFVPAVAVPGVLLGLACLRRAGGGP